MATLLVGGALLAVVAAIVWKMVADHRNGKSACGGNCAHCHGSCGAKHR